MELSKQQIRPILLYEFKRGTNASQTHRNLCEVFGQDVITVRSCQFWFEKFRNGDFNLEDEPRSGAFGHRQSALAKQSQRNPGYYHSRARGRIRSISRNHHQQPPPTWLCVKIEQVGTACIEREE
ncbi:Histone-lysine N-methyltransferase SETMAR [Ooceraea biroi]|uniref:Histone-lysine N-methyltransferase SETMAR n=1 Tax=Ooceraea biroi TaxID=2015173 RepID=A0A026W8S2_OOCBI|nr:Histone-lysine N-methyltransferase SETMAR [Ooceraea biroi]